LSFLHLHWNLKFGLALILQNSLERISIHRTNKYRDSGSPCLSPPPLKVTCKLTIDIDRELTWCNTNHDPINDRSRESDANLVIMWLRNPHAKTPIPRKPSKSGLIGVWHKDKLYLGTSTIANGNSHPTNIDSRTKSIRMTPRRQLFFDKSFFSLFYGNNHNSQFDRWIGLKVYVESSDRLSYLGLKLQVNQSLGRHLNTGQQRLYEFCYLLLFDLWTSYLAMILFLKRYGSLFWKYTNSTKIFNGLQHSF
jgi:hypothetical protein